MFLCNGGGQSQRGQVIPLVAEIVPARDSNRYYSLVVVNVNTCLSGDDDDVARRGARLPITMDNEPLSLAGRLLRAKYLEEALILHWTNFMGRVSLVGVVLAVPIPGEF